MPEIHINGKWLGQRFTGVQRYSDELASRVVGAGGFDFVLHVPKGAAPPRWAESLGVRVRHAPLGGILFEQLYLPWATRGRLLLNFGGIAPLLKRRQIVTFHDAATFRFPGTYQPLFVAFYFVAYLILSRTARQVLTVSEFSRGELADVLHVDPSRFLVIHCAADSLVEVESRQPDVEWLEGAYLVVGTLARHKNLLAPVRALAASGRHVVVVGAAGAGNVFADESTSFGQNVAIAKGLTDAELRWLYENSRALVFPSSYEGFGLPVLEAQTLGCPVIASNAASIPEVAGDGALYFDPDDTEGLLRQVDALERDPALADRLIERGRVNATRFGWRKSADQVLQRIRDLKP